MGLGEAVQIGTMLTVTAISSVLLIVLGVIYFAVSLVIIKVSAGLVGYSAVSAETAVLSAAILSAASLVASNRK
ncbi:Uncharacterised protein [uncultured archaeon]|nr:Uncharacterised protein [uncultured archaeon]